MGTKAWGTSIEDVPEPHRYKWPESEETRKVRIELISFKGSSPNATHWYADLVEEMNPIWDATPDLWLGNTVERGWVICHDHPKEQKGLRLESKFVSKTVAKGWIQDQWLLYFNDGKHEFTEHEPGELDWLKRRLA